MSEMFAQFWDHYPRRVGKLAAQRAFARALKQASADDILRGLIRALRFFPREERFIPHPATWLNQGRWMDDLPDVVIRGAQEDWFEVCKRVHGGACGLDRWRHHTRMQMEQAS